MNEETSLEVIKLNLLLQLTLYTMDDLKNKKLTKDVRSSIVAIYPTLDAARSIIERKQKLMISTLFEVDEDLMNTLIEEMQYKFDELKDLKISDLVNVI